MQTGAHLTRPPAPEPSRPNPRSARLVTRGRRYAPRLPQRNNCPFAERRRLSQQPPHLPELRPTDSAHNSLSELRPTNAAEHFHSSSTQPMQPMRRNFAAKRGKRPHPPVWSPQNRTRPTRPMLRAVSKIAPGRLGRCNRRSPHSERVRVPRWANFVASTPLSQSVRSRCTGLPIPNGAAT